MQSAVAAMKNHNGEQGGNILVTGATSSIRGREGFAAFAASKGGLRQICQSVAREYGPHVSSKRSSKHIEEESLKVAGRSAFTLHTSSLTV